MGTIRATAAEYYSVQEALKAAEQLIELLQTEHERGFFDLEDVILKGEEDDLVFSGAEYLAFARRGVREARKIAKLHDGQEKDLSSEHPADPADPS